MKYLLCLLSVITSAVGAQIVSDTDPYLWLEEITGERALDWVAQHNSISSRELEADPSFSTIHSRLLSIYESNERIPYVTKHGKYFYNFWRDAQHERGIWRRTTLDEYRKPVPAWETILDLDALAAEEKENWVWMDTTTCVRPSYDRCLISLSRGGGDARVVREFDIELKKFIPNGFNLAEAKSEFTWRNRNEIYVATDFGPGSFTDAGYSRIIKRWHRGTPLDSAETIFVGKSSDVVAEAIVSEQRGYHREIIQQQVTAFTSKYLLIEQNNLRELNLPLDADLLTFRDQMLVRLRSDWQVSGQRYVGGALLAISWEDFLQGRGSFEILYTPSARGAISWITTTHNYVLIGELFNVHSRVHVLHHNKNTWRHKMLPTPPMSTVEVTPVDEFASDKYFLTIEGFISPGTLYLGAIGQPQRELLKTLPAFFRTDKLQVTQHEAISKDGTHIPYFQVSRRDITLDGHNPALLYGYGGFEISLDPYYSPTVGSTWLERGGIYVLANIRGGGEFGPQWHQAALKENRQSSYNDFIAIAEDLIARKVTSPKHLGIMGGSNGGLLMGVMLTQRPELFGAIVCDAPLLDMHRYHKLLAGASWMDEYGDPDKPDEWAYISRYSPYQNLHADQVYPPVLFTSSTRDDRVHPGHARKMAAAMLSHGGDVLYYENTEGGHSGSANNKQHAYINALEYTFLWRHLK